MKQPFILRAPILEPLMDLHTHFTFEVPNAKFTPAYRNKIWDGRIRLLNSQNWTLPYGLLFDGIDACKDRGYKFALEDDLKKHSIPSREECKDYIDSMVLYTGTTHIDMRDYQLEAFTHGVREGRSLIISPTGSGKSLIIYSLIRWHLDYSDGKVLVIVPTTSLVEQLTKDFADYSSHDDEFDAEEEIHQIYSGKDRNNIAGNVVITTWQSAVKMDKNWFLQYGAVFGDECHLFKAKSLGKIMGMCVNASTRVGTTGTLDGSLCNERVLIGHFGPVYNVTTTKALMDKNQLAQLKITSLVLKHEDQLCKAVKKMDYHSEIDTIVGHTGRNRLISNLAVDQEDNTLVLFNFVEKHGKPLHSMIKDKTEDGRHVFYVSGEVDALAREEIREITEKESNAIIVASMGTFSTGINIKNLHNIIFASPTKSQIRVLQSIGRGLRISDNGKPTNVYDLTDDFSWGKRENYTLKHGQERMKIYLREGFDVEFHRISLSV